MSSSWCSSMDGFSGSALVALPEGSSSSDPQTASIDEISSSWCPSTGGFSGLAIVVVGFGLLHLERRKAVLTEAKKQELF